MSARLTRADQRAELLDSLRYQTRLSLRVATRRDAAMPIIEAVAHAETMFERIWGATPELVKSFRRETVAAALAEIGVTNEAIEARKAEIAADLPAAAPRLTVVGGIE